MFDQQFEERTSSFHLNRRRESLSSFFSFEKISIWLNISFISFAIWDDHSSTLKMFSFLSIQSARITNFDRRLSLRLTLNSYNRRIKHRIQRVRAVYIGWHPVEWRRAHAKCALVQHYKRREWFLSVSILCKPYANRQRDSSGINQRLEANKLILVHRRWMQLILYLDNRWFALGCSRAYCGRRARTRKSSFRISSSKTNVESRCSADGRDPDVRNVCERWSRCAAATDPWWKRHSWTSYYHLLDYVRETSCALRSSRVESKWREREEEEKSDSFGTCLCKSSSPKTHVRIMCVDWIKLQG